MDPPVPVGWTANPRMTEIPEIPPEGYIEIGIEIRPSGSFSDTALLGTSVSITTGYMVDYGHLDVQIRVENRTPKSYERSNFRSMDAFWISNHETTFSRKSRSWQSTPDSSRNSKC